MACSRCFSFSSRLSPIFAQLSRSAAKAAGAQLRRLGRLSIAPDWASRAETCARCPMRVSHAGKTYCGTPYLKKIDRDPGIDGCGCPVNDKAKAPDEHCPLNTTNRPAEHLDGQCNCKWCSLAAARNRSKVLS